MSHKQAKAARQKARREAAKRLVTESSSHRRKLAWAETHIDEFEAVVVAWSSDGYRITKETDSEGRTREFAQLVEPIPEELSLIAGDALQCLRHSLDHIVFALSKKGTPTMTPDDEEQPQFPITRGAPPVGASNGRIQFLTKPARTALLDVTPDPTRQKIDGEPLFLLNKMGNRDKHREIPLLAVSHSTNLALNYARGGTLRTYGGDVLELNAKPVLIVEYTADMAHPSNAIRPTPLIQFGPGVEVEGRQVVPTLRWMHDHIRDTVFQSLEPHF